LAVTKEDENKLKVVKNKVLRKIYRPTTDNGEWRIRYKHKLHKLLDQPYTI
jgi:hypothetical protein